MTKFIVNDKTDAYKTGINLFSSIANCQIVRSRSLSPNTNYKLMCLPGYWLLKLANERTRIKAVIVKNEIDGVIARA